MPRCSIALATALASPFQSPINRVANHLFSFGVDKRSSFHIVGFIKFNNQPNNKMNKTNIANLNRFKSWLNRTCREVMCDDGTPFYENNKHYTKECSSAKDEFCNVLGDDAFWTLASDEDAPEGQDEYGISNDILYAEEQIDIAFEKACI